MVLKQSENRSINLEGIENFSWINHTLNQDMKKKNAKKVNTNKMFMNDVNL